MVNFMTTKKVKENEKSLTEQAQWEQRNLGQNSSSFMPPVVQPSLQPPMPPHAPLTIGYVFSPFLLLRNIISKVVRKIERKMCD
jgi:hypothetical protein